MRVPSARSPIRPCSRWRRAITSRVCDARSAAAWDLWRDRSEGREHGVTTSNDEMLALSSVELRRRIGTKEVSPVDLMEAAIARIEAINPAVNAIAATGYA